MFLGKIVTPHRGGGPLAPLTQALGSILGPKAERPLKLAGLMTILYFVNPFGLIPRARPGGFLSSMHSAFGHMVQLMQAGALNRGEE